MELGCLTALNSNINLTQVQVWIGTSTSAILALLFTCGYSVQEVLDRVLPAIQEKKLTDLGTMTQVLLGDGFISSTVVKTWLVEQVLSRCGSVPTLKGLYLQTGKTFGCTTLSTIGLQLMTWQTDPQLSCVEACMRAINIPYLAHPQLAYTDALLALPSPVEYFDDGVTPVLNIMSSSDAQVMMTFNNNVVFLQEESNSLTIALQSLISLIKSRQADCIDRTTTAVRHLLLTSNLGPMRDLIPRTNPDYSDVGSLLASGFCIGWKNCTEGYQEPELAGPVAFKYEV